MAKRNLDPETRRLAEEASRKENWKRWGPYLSERQWGTVREDYSPNGDVWNHFPHDHARSRAYRWGEDGLLGICDRQCRLCFAVALWNGRDPILKERLFGVTNGEGNHGEDVKECYWYLDSTPTHSYMKALYRYPQAEYPYAKLVGENRWRGRGEPEYELGDTGVLDGGRFFDVTAEYAKGGPNDVLVRVRLVNQGPEAAELWVLPTVWFRNTWAWGCKHEGCTLKPRLSLSGEREVTAEHETLGQFTFAWSEGTRVSAKREESLEEGDVAGPELVFTDNETNLERLYGATQGPKWVKDAFHAYVIGGDAGVVNDQGYGTKAAGVYRVKLGPGQEAVLRGRLWEVGSSGVKPGERFGSRFEKVFEKRLAEADTYYASHGGCSCETGSIARQAYAGLLWSKQFYHYVIKDWLEGDPAQPAPPPQRAHGRNRDWLHLYNRDVVSMPDKWEYPWYAAWDLAFHMIPMAVVDPDFAKWQLELFLREWYMHPNGQIPAYEFELSDVNPPVHAWAVWRVYKMTGPRGGRDRAFLASCFQKLLLNFTWWVNRKDPDGNHIFAGGFLGLDNIGVFDRSRPLPTGGRLQQADGTAWMAFYCGTMLSMALELAKEDPVYQDMASKFFEHFVAIMDAMNTVGTTGLWDERDGFYYDVLRANGHSTHLRIRSLVGLIPLCAVEVLEKDLMETTPGFARRTRWFLKYRKDLARHISYMEQQERGGQYLLAVPSRERLKSVLRYLLDESEFLSPHGVRSLSKVHLREPYRLDVAGQRYEVRYEPGESESDLFGGNSNWRGPVWFPVNYLLIEALERYHRYYGDSFQVECPVGSGKTMNLQQVADEIAGRLTSLFACGRTGRRPCHGTDPRYAKDPLWKGLTLFHEYFHGDTGKGLGASHQTGWTALVTRLLAQCEAKKSKRPAAKPKSPTTRPRSHKPKAKTATA